MRNYVVMLVSIFMLTLANEKECLASPDEELLKAIYTGNAAKVSAELTMGANANLVDPVLKQSVLVIALAKQDLPTAETLLMNGANPSLDISLGEVVLTPLHLAVKQKDLTLVDLLLKHHADYAKTDNFGSTPLMLATTSDQAETVVHLLEAGANVNQRDKLDRTALHWAVFLEREGIAKVLVDRGADVNLITKDGKTPLSLAKMKNNMRLSELLTAAGAKN